MTDEDHDPKYPVAELVGGGENDLADAIREAIGADPDERIEVVLPQFERTDGVDVDWYPEDRMDIYSLCTASEAELEEVGLRRWAEDEDLWLFPSEWYDHIPDGTLIEDINGNVEEFEHGKTDPDRRFGVLPYGIVRQPDADSDDEEGDREQ